MIYISHSFSAKIASEIEQLWFFFPFQSLPLMREQKPFKRVWKLFVEKMVPCDLYCFLPTPDNMISITNDKANIHNM